jgi:chromosome segregation ATPase
MNDTEQKIDTEQRKYSSNKTAEKLKRAELKIETFQAENEILENKNAHLQNELKEHQSKLSELEPQINKVSIEKTKAEDELSNECYRHNDTKLEYKNIVLSTTKELEKSRATIQSKDDAYLLLKDDFHDSKEKYTSLKTQHQILQNSYDNTKTEIDVLKIKIKHHDLILQNYEDQVRKISIENDLLDTQYRKYRQDNVNLNRQLESFRGTYAKHFPNGLNRGMVDEKTDGHDSHPNDRDHFIEIVETNPQKFDLERDDNFYNPKRQVELVDGKHILTQEPNILIENHKNVSTKHPGIINFRRTEKLGRR